MVIALWIIAAVLGAAAFTWLGLHATITHRNDMRAQGRVHA